MKPFVLLALSAFTLGSAQTQAQQVEQAPYVHVMLLQTNATQEETDAALALQSLAGSEGSYIIPADHGIADNLLRNLSSSRPRILSEADIKPSTRIASTALETVLDAESYLIRTKARGIVEDRFTMWLGIQRSSAGSGPAKVLERVGVPLELAYGEAAVTRITPKLLVAVIPGSFESQATLIDTQPALSHEIKGVPVEQASLTRSDQSEDISETYIRWDAPEGAVLPDAEGLRRILQEP